jgi:hypothetical protein
MKTLTVILHYNSCQYTDTLYELLKPEEGNDYDLSVIDNGSDEGRKSKYTTLSLDRNIYFGGSLGATFEWVLNEPNYDSLLFLNSDLIVGKHFVSSLRKELNNGYDIVSPSILQPSFIQNHWQQMLPHGCKNIRPVRWIDLQAPLFSRRFIEKVKRFDDLLIYGWLIDVLCGIECEKNDWKIGVCDFVPAIHLSSSTINDNKHKPDIADYCRRAEENQWIYSQREGITDKVLEMRHWAENYTP